MLRIRALFHLLLLNHFCARITKRSSALFICAADNVYFTPSVHLLETSLIDWRGLCLEMKNVVDTGTHLAWLTHLGSKPKKEHPSTNVTT